VSTQYNVNIQAILAFECVQVCVLQRVRCSVCGAQRMLALCSVAVRALQCLLQCVLQRVRCSVCGAQCVLKPRTVAVCVRCSFDFCIFFHFICKFQFYILYAACVDSTQ